ncbi:MAG TPA: hypothetical protein VK399_13830 [Longimicrobiaceae bacterium]|nr:hypothetical protein [Longimicrobiaceae bacterium]
MRQKPQTAQPGDPKKLAFFASLQNAERLNFLWLGRPGPLLVRLVNDGWDSFLTQRAESPQARARIVADFSAAGPLEFSGPPAALPGWELEEGTDPGVFAWRQTARYWSWFADEFLDLRFPSVVAGGEAGMGTVTVRLENVEGGLSRELRSALLRLRGEGAPNDLSATWKYAPVVPVSATLTDDGGGVLKLVIGSSSQFIRPSGEGGGSPRFFVTLSDGYSSEFRALAPPEAAAAIQATVPDNQPWAVSTVDTTAYPVWRLDYDPTRPAATSDVQLKLSDVHAAEPGHAQVIVYFLNPAGTSDGYQVLTAQAVPQGRYMRAYDRNAALDESGGDDGGITIAAFTVDNAQSVTLNDLKAPSTVTLAWDVRGAGYVTISGIGATTTLAGSQAVQVSQTTVFTLTAFSPSLAAAKSASATVTVQPDLLTRVIPRGTIVLWSGSLDPTALPAGWWPCDGTHGTPNLRDRFVLGAGGTEQPNDSGDATTHTHAVAPPSQAFTSSQDGQHSHLMPSAWYKRNLSCGKWAGIDSGGTDPRTTRSQSDGLHSHQVTVTIPAFTSGPNDQEFRPPWYALAYLMKLGV